MHAAQGTTSHNPDTGDSDQYETQSNQTLHTLKHKKHKHTRRRDYNPYVQYRNAPQQNMNANSCLIFT